MVSVRQNLTGLRASLLTSLIAAAALSGSTAIAATTNYDSYTTAYEKAGEAHQPMLVVLNGDGVARVDVDALSEDKMFASAAENYVVAEIDTNTAHGEEVHKLFKSPALPAVVVIDDEQRKQLFKTSRAMSATELAGVLNDYKDGPPSAPKTVSATKPIVTSDVTSYGTPVQSARSRPRPFSRLRSRSPRSLRACRRRFRRTALPAS